MHQQVQCVRQKVPAQSREQYSVDLQMSGRMTCKEIKLDIFPRKDCTTEDSQSVTGVGGQPGHLVSPRKIMADNEAQTFE